MSNLTRRKLLAGLSGASVIALAGCTEEDTSEPSGGSENSDDGQSSDDSQSSDDESSGDGGSSDQQERPPGARWYDSNTEIGVLEDVEADVDSIGIVYIRGIAKNFSDTDYDYVQLEWELYDDSDRKIADGLANTSRLAADQEWRFEASAANAEDVSSYTLVNITAY